MIIHDTKTFLKGLFMLVTFLAVLTIMFLPIFNGMNSMEAADELFNSISKGSVDFFSVLKKKNENYKDVSFDLNLKLADKELATKAEKTLKMAGVDIQRNASEIKAQGLLGKTLDAALKDSEAMFNNQDQTLLDKYGFSGREALFVWHRTLKEMDLALTQKKDFKAANFVSEVTKKGVEVGYNFFSIEGTKARSKAGILTFSMVFYIIYTLWYGLAILLLFEGLGMKLKAKPKKEV